MLFRVGQKVVCIDASRADRSRLAPGFRYEENGLKEGEVYTVTATGLVHPCDLDHRPCIRVQGEIIPFWAHRFRPVVERKTDTGFAIITEILNGTRVPETAA